MVSSDVVCVIRSDVLAVVSSDVLAVVGSDILAIVGSSSCRAVLLMKLCALDLLEKRPFRVQHGEKSALSLCG